MLHSPLTELEKIFFFILLVFGLGFFAWGVLYRFHLIRKGEKDKVAGDFLKRLKIFTINVIFQKKLFKENFRGVMHLFVYYGFIVYSITTINQMIEGFVDGFHLPVFLDAHYRITSTIYAYTIDIFSLLVLIGIFYFAIRRYVFKAGNLDRPSWQSAIVILAITVHMVSGMILEVSSYQIATSYTLKPFAHSVIRESLAGLFVSQSSLEQLVKLQSIGWWMHIIAVLGFAAIVPRIKHIHLLFAPFNFWFSRLEPVGRMSFVDLEAEDGIWGVKNIQDYKWTSLLDGFACIECGRCTDQCPAFATDKPLNPKQVVINTRHAVLDLLPGFSRQLINEENEESFNKPVYPDYIGIDTMWSCTTCMACVEACPVGNSPMEKLTDTRRARVLLDAEFSTELQNTFVNMENQSNPWGIGSDKRADWAQGLDVTTMAEKSDVDYLYWVGCAGSFDERAKKVSVALVKLLQKANVSFSILGSEEMCSGDSARRGGNEYLYQTLAQSNVDTMNNYGVKKIIATCPHCFNTIKNEYPQFGGNFEVIHHAEFLQQLIQEGKLNIPSNNESKELTYHDSCYLGRYNRVFEAPRQVITKAGFAIKEVERSGTKSFCCGAGGAQMWMEESSPRINDNRTEELLDQNTATIATNCPFCMTMLEDGVKNKEKEEEVKVQDIAEILAGSLGL